MKKIKAIKVAGAILAGLLLLTAVWQIGQAFTSKELLTEEEASSLVQDKYNGRMIEISERSGIFQIKFSTDAGEYTVEISRETGEIRNLIKLDQESPVPKKVWSQAEIREQVAQQEKGEIEKVEQKQEGENLIYSVVVRSETQITTLKIDAYTGETVDTITEEIKQPEEEPAKRLTESEAVEIALQRVEGEVDDVELEQSNGVIYYLIEVEREEEEDATVQVNALSGEIMSVTWED
ncbi:PepSY domain-containing protein [Bacillus litorisediminis]|uniref:PepSY domain-containing protein n=1 Tax=Bacillus litorisediminis TaxID=2922713 RepID=UPI001FAFEC4A|nr:PepSY domain-containing protein [Bacillus litorisediminis]